MCAKYQISQIGKRQYQSEQIPSPGAVNLSFKVESILTFAAFVNIVLSGAGNVYLSFGDGTFEKVSESGSDPVWINKTYAVGDTTYDIKLYGDLDVVKKFQASGAGWNFNVTEFLKTENIEFLGTTGFRPNQLYGTITGLISLKEWWLSAPIEVNEDGIFGNTDSLVNLEVFECNGQDQNFPMANVTGDFANLPNLKQHCVVHKLMGDMTTLVNLEYFSWGYALGTPIDPQIQGDQSVARIWGDISDYTELYYIACNGGAATITGSVALLANMEVFQYVPPLLTRPANLQSMPKLCRWSCQAVWELTEAEVNQWLADLWANREEVRTWFKNTVGTFYGIGWRDSEMSLNVSSAVPTGQGIIDRKNLNTTVNPAAPGNGVRWTITTRLGPEEVTNWNFANWTADFPDNFLQSGEDVNNYVTEGSGLRFVSNKTGFFLYQVGVLTIGLHYRIQVVCTEFSGDGLRVYNGSGAEKLEIKEAGTHSIEITADGAPIYIHSLGTTDLTLASVSFKEFL